MKVYIYNNQMIKLMMFVLFSKKLTSL